MKIAFYPNIQKGENAYTMFILEALKKASPDALIESFPTYREIFKGNFDADIAWTGWLENQPTTRLYFFRFLILKVLALPLLKRKGVRIYSTFHNKQPHETLYPKLNKWLFKYILRNADKIIILSDESKKYIKELIGDKGVAKAVKISHPAYEIVERKLLPDYKENFTALFFGMLRPYKNIELILKAAEENREINFIIAGRPISEEYAKELKTKIETLPNVTLIPEFQNDSQIEDLISKSSIVILPYDKKSSLNSGVLYFSFSKGINVIIPDIASVGEFKNKDLIYHYDYDQESNHFDSFNLTLRRAWEDFKVDTEGFLEKARKLQEEVSLLTTDFLANQIKEANLLIKSKDKKH